MGANWDELGAAPPRMNVSSHGGGKASRVSHGNSRSWMLRYGRVAAPMGPTPSGDAPTSTIVYHFARGANVVDVDDNVYVDLAAGFG